MKHAKFPYATRKPRTRNVFLNIGVECFTQKFPLDRVWHDLKTHLWILDASKFHFRLGCIKRNVKRNVQDISAARLKEPAPDARCADSHVETHRGEAEDGHAWTRDLFFEDDGTVIREQRLVHGLGHA